MTEPPRETDILQNTNKCSGCSSFSRRVRQRIVSGRWNNEDYGNHRFLNTVRCFWCSALEDTFKLCYSAHGTEKVETLEAHTSNFFTRILHVIGLNISHSRRRESAGGRDLLRLWEAETHLICEGASSNWLGSFVFQKARSKNHRATDPERDWTGSVSPVWIKFRYEHLQSCFKLLVSRSVERQLHPHSLGRKWVKPPHKSRN